MSIKYDEKNNIFNLQTKDTSYVIGILYKRLPVHIHYGKRIEKTYAVSDMTDYDFSKDGSCTARNLDFDEYVCEDTMPLEFPVYGSGYYGEPVFNAQYADGSTVSRLYFTEHKIYRGKPELEGLPSSYSEDDNEVETLELHLKDELTDLEVIIYYSVFYNHNVIARSHKIINNGKNAVRLKQALSGCINLWDNEYDFVNLEGAWARERHVQKSPVIKGTQYVESRRGASSHAHNPFFCISQKGATEDYGDIYAMNLLYSGNFVSGVYKNTDGHIKIYTGINPFDFEWYLDKGEAFTTPECVMTYSCEGFGKMSNNFHAFVRDCISRGEYKYKARPVLLNNWEATYFNFDEEKIVNIAKKASEAGVELMVLDDGWFGKRNDDKSSLGDWFVNREKLPNGIDGLCRKINDIGMKFGLWFEPEMISENSDLYRAHPDWCLHVEGRSRSISRTQMVLDLSRADVCEYIVKSVSDILENSNIEYIKWDMNRNMSEVGSALLPPERQRETAHRYMLGLYDILGKIKKRFPHVLMEGCSGGGGRFDLGMLCYFNQFWTSDDTDAVERQYIQEGTSYAYPVNVMGAHVSAVPNHQVQRVTDIKTRGYVAMPGQFGYELDLAKLADEEFEEVKNQIKFYKEFENVFHYGTMYRIISPFERDMTVWEFVSEDKKTAIVEIFTIKAVPNTFYWKTTIRLKGLDKDAMYKDRFTGKVYSGEALMNIGLKQSSGSDFDARVLVLEKM